MAEQVILLDHGAGGRLSRELVAEVIYPRLANPLLAPLHDGAVVDLAGGRLALTTDSYVVDPLFFPGGDIGRLAVCGTVNDLAMCGARPLYLTLGLILEEGLPLADLVRVLDSVQAAAAEAEVLVVSGDTKVVGRGAADKLFINTAGVGLVLPGVHIGPDQARPGDVVLVSGTLGDHGATILSQRQGLGLRTSLRSDAAPLAGLAARLLEAVPATRVLRDPTRGGLASALNEIAASSQVGMVLEEADLPLREEVRAVSEILGLDPLYLANEGKLVAIVPAEAAEVGLAALRADPLGQEARLIGRVTAGPPGRVTLRTSLGSTRLVGLLTGEPLPRIC